MWSLQRTDSIGDFSHVRSLPGLGLLLATLLLTTACGADDPIQYGEPVAANEAVPVGRFLASAGSHSEETVVLSGKVGEVCEESGCWFVLQGSESGKYYSVLIDLAPSAGFTVPAGIRGNAAVVKGKLAGRAPDLKLLATGLEVG